MAELQLPPYSPPLAGWIVIALLYHSACCVVLYQLLRLEQRSTMRVVAFVLIGVIMSINSFWNYLFFRKKDVRASFVISLPYCILALGLTGLLFRLDSFAAWAVLPYVVYLGYGAWWGYNLWRLNERGGAA